MRCFNTFIILGLRAWWKEAKKDGKIDKEEMEEGAKIIEDGIKGIQTIIQDKEEKK